MTKTQCFVKRSKEGAHEIIEGIFSIKNYGHAVIGMIMAIVVVLLVIFPLVIYALTLFTLNPTNAIYIIGLGCVFIFIEIIWVKCIAFPLISCMDDDHQVGDSDHLMRDIHPFYKAGRKGVQISTISPKKLAEIKKCAIKKWHWERTEGGIKPVADEEST